MKWKVIISNYSYHCPKMLITFISLITYSFAKATTSTTISSSPLNSFYCYTDYSVADKPFNFVQKSTSIFDRPCGCKTDWKKTFCNNVKKYSKMKVADSPHVCICRQINDKESSCEQIMTRCFSEKRNNYQTCSCCFHQPDDYCTQLDCKNLEPDFGRGSNTSCICHDQNNYPKHICLNQDVSPRYKLKSLFSVTSQPNYGITSADGTLIYGSGDPNDSMDPPFYTAVWKVIKTNKLVLAFIIILLIGVFAAIIFGCVVICFGKKQSNRRTNTRREKRSINEKRLLETTQNDVEGYLP